VGDSCSKEPPSGYPAFHSKCSETAQVSLFLDEGTRVP
jgi:hypothetical protein